MAESKARRAVDIALMATAAIMGLLSGVVAMCIRFHPVEHATGSRRRGHAHQKTSSAVVL